MDGTLLNNGSTAEWSGQGGKSGMDEFGSHQPGRRILPALICIAAAFSSLRAWAAGPQVAVNIPAGDATQTLLQFYAQSNVQVLYLAADVQGRQTQAVSGTMDAEQVLKRMLEGTGLTFEFENDLSAMVTLAPAAVSSSSGSLLPPPPVPTPVVNANALKMAGEVVVTGSLIRGVMDVISPLQVVERRQMQSSAYATVQDAIEQLPINSPAMQNEIFGGTGNFNRGTALNLRGLGSGATLVLVNGRRQPQAGIEADFVDVSMIPWSAVDHIEVLPDGSSALYGSDAVAGVINIILRDEIAGAESQVRFGAAPFGAAETHAAQLFGGRWSSGKWLAGYQYNKRTSLAAADRAYTRDSDKRSLGGSNYSSLKSSPGNILDPKTLQPLFAIPSGQDGTALDPADLLGGEVNWNNLFSGVELVPDRQMHSVFVNGAQQIGERIELFGEGRLSMRDIRQRPYVGDNTPLLAVPSTNPFFVDPFGGSPYVIVAYDLSQDLGPFTGVGKTHTYTGTLGAKARLGESWQATLATSAGQETLHWSGYGQVNNRALNLALADSDPATAFNPFGDGPQTSSATLDAIRSVQHENARSTVVTTTLIGDGSLVDLPGGTAKLALGAERRSEGLDRPTLHGNYSRQIAAGFTELSVPLVGVVGSPKLTPRLELSLAGRYEQYSDFGNTFNPKAGLRWAPSEALKLRGSWGTSFKAPKLVDLYDTSRSAAVLVSLQDPKSPSRRSIVLARQGNNPNLTEETASSVTAGIDLAPPAIPGLTLSLTWYSIDYKNQVIQPGPLSPFDILLHEEEWASVITRDPPQALVDEICSSPQFVMQASQCQLTPPSVIVDVRRRNLAATETQGIDFTLDHKLRSVLGDFNFKLNGKYALNFKQAFTDSTPAVDVLDTVYEPLSLRVRSSLEWKRYLKDSVQLNAQLTADHTGSYRDTLSTARNTVGSLTTYDLRLGLHTAKGGAMWDDLTFTLNAVNVLDKKPPFVDREWGFDVFNAEPFGRVVSLYVEKAW